MAASHLIHWKISAIFLALCFTCLISMQVIDNHSLEQKVDEYFLEHEVSQWEAVAAARAIVIEEETPAGCKPCTSEQMLYCVGDGLLSDHCCCDKRYEETLPFIPHSCYLSAKPCTLHAANCGEYYRLRRCCCDVPLRRKWKAKSSANTRTTSTFWFLLPAAIYLLL